MGSQTELEESERDSLIFVLTDTQVTQLDTTYIVKVADLGLGRELHNDAYNSQDALFPVKVIF